MIRSEDDMNVSDRDPIPEHFSSADEAGEFWDTHSAADYWDEMETVEMEFDIQKRVFLVPVDGQIYHRIKQQAEKEHRSVEQVIQALLERELA
jgi:vacuolar-type H+-ATPase subunit C/Vma6